MDTKMKIVTPVSTLGDLFRERPEDFQNPPMADAELEALMARNRAKSEREDAAAGRTPEDYFPEDDEDEAEENDEENEDE